MFCKKAVPKNFATFAEKYLCWSFFSAFKPATLLKRDSRFKNSFFYRTPPVAASAGCFEEVVVVAAPVVVVVVVVIAVVILYLFSVN